MKKALILAVLFASACAIGRIETPEGIIIKGLAIGNAELEVCVSTTTTSTSTSTTTSSTIDPRRAMLPALTTTVLVPDLTHETTTTTLPDEPGCARIKGGSFSSAFVDVVSLAGSAMVAFFTHGAIF